MRLRQRHCFQTTVAARAGYTLVELIISTLSASLLMAGLASSLFLSIRSFDGTSTAAATTRAADVHADVLNDLKHATGFTTRTSNTVTFTVPDRDGDLAEETITYQWTGLPTAELQYSINGGPAVTVLEDVQQFDVAYLNRSITGNSPSPPAMDSSQWGMRWYLPTETFGYEIPYLLTDSDRRIQIGTRATLSEPGTVVQLSVYLTIGLLDNSDYTMAIYDVDNNDNPKNLLAHTALANASSTGWHSLPVAPTPLTPGEYYLAVSYKDSAARHHYDVLLGETHESPNDASKKNEWQSSWNSTGTSSRRVAIYATYEPD
ncbi:hypothetical protein Mal4_18410 [Maioricimonas rarisocia]|uniref:Prepilin-type N-terminal cleavage/methylation domain-containing protein n=1 Tax=Maioricimonas rarisocia TaxID=2528026 RepID=A0A517Z501_9PLAN|nr:hypothetical protein [Maioricimonas rarisocia]QDU37527.1 hypothetical protein Mal4_18410 [Maioricimonas rarisocia]